MHCGRKRLQVLRFLLRGRDQAQQVHIALIRRRAVQGNGPQHRVTCCLKDQSTLRLVQADPTPLWLDMQGQQACLARQLIQFFAQGLGRPM